MKRSHIAIVSAFFVAFAVKGVSAQHHKQGKGAGIFMANSLLATPSSIHEEHKHLHHQLDEALASGGKTGASAKVVADALLPHFEAEEAYAMPPLGLLESIADGQPLSGKQIDEAIKMADQLRTNYEQMIKEHRQIEAALKTLASAARQEHKPEALAFAEALMLHAQNEEQVLYPTTLLIGKYLKLRQASGQ